MSDLTSDKLAQLSRDIAAAEAHLQALRRQHRDEYQRLRREDAAAKLAKLPADVREMLRPDKPRAEDARRLVARNLAYKQFYGAYVWCGDALEMREILLEEKTP